MVFEIDPYIGAGLLRFGMTTEQVSSELKSKAQKFYKTQSSDTRTDTFEWCHAYYKEDGLLEAVEFFEPAKVTFKGINLLNLPFEEAKELFGQLDDEIEVDGNGFISYKFGVGVFVPFHEAPVEGVIVFEKGYYDI